MHKRVSTDSLYNKASITHLKLLVLSLGNKNANLKPCKLYGNNFTPFMTKKDCFIVSDLLKR